jgi:lipoate-protein ligase A
MACDEALMARAHQEGVGILRLYSWSHPAITFGRNEALLGRFDRSALEASEFELVRRPTGGRALLHVHELTYAVAVPLPSGHSWRPVYDAINQKLRDALVALGVRARIVGDGEFPALQPAGALCFAVPSTGEIVVDDAKIVASAVWRDQGSFLQQGSILIDGDQGPLESLTNFGALPSGAVATLRSCGVSAGFDELATSIVTAFAGGTVVIDMSDDVQMQRDAELRVNHFREQHWLWRR